MFERRESLKNPFRANIQDVVEYLDHFSATEVSLVEYNRVRSFLLGMVGVSDEEEKAFRKILKINEKKGEFVK